MKKLLALVICALLSFSLFGCGKSVTMKTDNGKTTITKDKDTGTIKTDTGTTNVSLDEDKSVALPKDYPKDLVPIIDGAVISSASKESKDGKDWYVVCGYVKKNYSDVMKYYEEKLADLSDKTTGNYNNSYTVTGTKNNSIIGVVAAQDSNDEKKCTLYISISPNE